MSDITSDQYVNFEQYTTLLQAQYGESALKLKAYIDAKDQATKQEAFQLVQDLLSGIDNLDEFAAKMQELQTLLGGEFATVWAQMQVAVRDLQQKTLEVDGKFQELENWKESERLALNLYKQQLSTQFEQYASQIGGLAGRLQTAEEKLAQGITLPQLVQFGNAVAKAFDNVFVINATTTP